MFYGVELLQNGSTTTNTHSLADHIASNYSIYAMALISFIIMSGFLAALGAQFRFAQSLRGAYENNTKIKYLEKIIRKYEQIETAVSNVISQISIEKIVKYAYAYDNNIAQKQESKVERRESQCYHDSINLMNNAIENIKKIHESHDGVPIAVLYSECYANLISRIGQNTKEMTDALNDLFENEQKLAKIDGDLNELYEAENHEFMSIIKSRVHHGRDQMATHAEGGSAC